MEPKKIIQRVRRPKTASKASTKMHLPSVLEIRGGAVFFNVGVGANNIINLKDK
jgi:hypothetical protein